MIIINGLHQDKNAFGGRCICGKPAVDLPLRRERVSPLNLGEILNARLLIKVHAEGVCLTYEFREKQ